MDISFGIETPSHVRILVESFGTIPPDVFRKYLGVIVREFSCIPMYSLTRFKKDNEQSPFRQMNWKSAKIQVQYVTEVPVLEYPVHEYDRIHGYIGIMSCRNDIKSMYQTYERRFENLRISHSSLLVRRLFAVEYDPESRAVVPEDEHEMKDLIIILPTPVLAKMRFYVERAVSDLFDALLKHIEKSVIGLDNKPGHDAPIAVLKKYADYALLFGDISDAAETVQRILRRIQVQPAKGSGPKDGGSVLATVGIIVASSKHRRTMSQPTSSSDSAELAKGGLGAGEGANVLLADDEVSVMESVDADPKRKGGRRRGKRSSVDSPHMSSGDPQRSRKFSNALLYGCCKEILACCLWVTAKSHLNDGLNVPYRGPPLSATLARHRPLAFPLEVHSNVVLRPSFPKEHILMNLDRDILVRIERLYNDVFGFYESAIISASGKPLGDPEADGVPGSRLSMGGSGVSGLKRKSSVAVSALQASLAARKRLAAYPILFRLYLQFAAFLGALRTEILAERKQEVTIGTPAPEKVKVSHEEWCDELKLKVGLLVNRAVAFSSEFDLKAPQKLAVFQACVLALAEIGHHRRRALLQLMVAREHHRKGADFVATMVGMLAFDAYKIPLRVRSTGEWELQSRVAGGCGWRTLQLPVIKLTVMYATNDPLARIRLMFFMLTEYHDLVERADQEAMFYHLDRYSKQIGKEIFTMDESGPVVACLSIFPIFHSIYCVPLPAGDEPVEEKEDELDSVFLFIPESFRKSPDGPTIVHWVQDEVNQVELTLRNPFLVDLYIRRVELKTAFECTTYSPKKVLPARSFLKIPLQVVPRGVGDLEISAGTVWINDVEGGLFLPIPVPSPEDLKLIVVAPLPLVSPRFSIPSLTVHEGEEVQNVILLDNVSARVACDALSIKITARPEEVQGDLDSPHAHAHPPSATPCDPDFAPESVVSFPPDAIPTELLPASTSRVPFRILVPASSFRHRVLDFLVSYSRGCWGRAKTVSLDVRCLKSLKISPLRNSMLRMTNSSGAGVVALLQGGRSVAVAPNHSKLLLDEELKGWVSEDNLAVRCSTATLPARPDRFRLRVGSKSVAVFRPTVVTATRVDDSPAKLFLRFVVDKAVCQLSGGLARELRSGEELSVRLRFFKSGTFVVVGNLHSSASSTSRVLCQRKVSVVVVAE